VLALCTNTLGEENRLSIYAQDDALCAASLIRPRKPRPRSLSLSASTCVPDGSVWFDDTPRRSVFGDDELEFDFERRISMMSSDVSSFDEGSAWFDDSAPRPVSIGTLAFEKEDEVPLQFGIGSGRVETESIASSFITTTSTSSASFISGPTEVHEYISTFHSPEADLLTPPQPEISFRPSTPEISLTSQEDASHESDSDTHSLSSSVSSLKTISSKRYLHRIGSDGMDDLLLNSPMASFAAMCWDATLAPEKREGNRDSMISISDWEKATWMEQQYQKRQQQQLPELNQTAIPNITQNRDETMRPKLRLDVEESSFPIPSYVTTPATSSAPPSFEAPRSAHHAPIPMRRSIDCYLSGNRNDWIYNDTPRKRRLTPRSTAQTVDGNGNGKEVRADSVTCHFLGPLLMTFPRAPHPHGFTSPVKQL